MKWPITFRCQAIMIYKKLKRICVFATISQHWNCESCCNISSWKTMTRLCCIASAMATGDLVTRGTRVSAAMALTYLSPNISYSTLEAVSPWLVTYKRTYFFPIFSVSNATFEHVITNNDLRGNIRLIEFLSLPRPWIGIKISIYLPQMWN